VRILSGFIASAFGCTRFAAAFVWGFEPLICFHFIGPTSRSIISIPTYPNFTYLFLPSPPGSGAHKLIMRVQESTSDSAEHSNESEIQGHQDEGTRPPAEKDARASAGIA
jgi:hypothetical protein